MPIHNPAPAVGGAPTQEFFVPVTYGTEMNFSVAFPMARCNAAYEQGNIGFHVPHDFSSITEAVAVIICRATQAAGAIDIYSCYAAAGEAYNTHYETDTASTYAMVNTWILEIDLAGILTSLAAGDYVGIKLMQRTVAHNFDILGVRFKYS